MLRFLLLRFLPRRLVPLLALIEIVRLVRQWRARDDSTVRATGPGAATSRVRPKPRA
jgi:hypothetical protein